MPKQKGSKLDVAGKTGEHFHCRRCEYKDEIRKVLNHIRSVHGVEEGATLCDDTTCFQTELSEKLPMEKSPATVEAGTSNPRKKSNRRKKKAQASREEAKDDGILDSSNHPTDSVKHASLDKPDREDDDVLHGGRKVSDNGFPVPDEEKKELSRSEPCIGEGAIEKDLAACSSIFEAVENTLTGPLHLYKKWIEHIKSLFNDNKVSPKVRNEEGETPLLFSLHFAPSTTCYDGWFWERLVELWRLLLEAGANPKVKDDMDRSLLYLLLNNLQSGQPHECHKLVSNCLPILQKYGFDINSRDSKGNTPLHLWASLANEPDDAVLEIGDVIISLGGAVSARNDSGETPLHLSQNWKFVDFLTRKGAHSNAQDLRGDTPLHKFIGKENLIEDEVSESRWECCLDAGMDPFCKNYEGKCPFEALLDKNLFRTALNLLKVIFENDYNRRELARSARTFKDRKGDSLLHILCVIENQDAQSVCEYLLQNGWDVNLRNEGKETALHMICSKVAKGSSFHPRIIGNAITLLRKYHADVSLPDGHGDSCVAMLCRSEYEYHRNLLLEDVEKVSIPNRIKWTPKSRIHRPALAEIARGSNSIKADCYHYHQKQIGEGSFSLVFPALNENDGREVALKRYEKARLKEKGDVSEGEVKCLLQLPNSPHVVNYINCTSDVHFKYLVFELMEGSLEDYVSAERECEDTLTICKDIASGLAFLHSREIVHRDLKPKNILYTTFPNLTFKISDFGLGKILTSSTGSGQSETVQHSRAGTKGWMAPELLKDGPKEHRKATDIFSCGLVFHYCMAKKKHAFGSYSDDSTMNVQETEKNIRKNRRRFCPSLTPEASCLLKGMLDKRPERRPTAPSLLQFPFFWENFKKVDFFRNVGLQIEFQQRRCNLKRPLTDVEISLERDYRFHRDRQRADYDWYDDIREILDAVTTDYPYRRYDTSSAVELVRFVRNVYSHPWDDYPERMRKQLADYTILRTFPFLLTILHNAVKASETWKTKRELKVFFEQ